VLANVWVDAWQMECCGEESSVGSEVTGRELHRGDVHFVGYIAQLDVFSPGQTRRPERRAQAQAQIV
jgi:hypothetical protein